MKDFGINYPEYVREINDKIIRKIIAGEAEYAAERLRKGYKVLGVKRLREQEILKPHKSRKSRGIFVLASTKEVRIAYIIMIKEHFDSAFRCTA